MGEGARGAPHRTRTYATRTALHASMHTHTRTAHAATAHARTRACRPPGPEPTRQPELRGRCSIVRELHVYGTAVAVHSRDTSKFQHQG